MKIEILDFEAEILGLEYEDCEIDTEMLSEATDTQLDELIDVNLANEGGARAALDELSYRVESLRREVESLQALQNAI